MALRGPLAESADHRIYKFDTPPSSLRYTQRHIQLPADGRRVHVPDSKVDQRASHRRVEPPPVSTADHRFAATPTAPARPKGREDAEWWSCGAQSRRLRYLPQLLGYR